MTTSHPARPTQPHRDDVTSRRSSDRGNTDMSPSWVMATTPGVRDDVPVDNSRVEWRPVSSRLSTARDTAGKVATDGSRGRIRTLGTQKGQVRSARPGVAWTGRDPMNRHDDCSARLAAALAACPSLHEDSPGWDELWMTLQETICTSGVVHVAPRGSSTNYRITPDYNDVELEASFTYLIRHEETARSMPPEQLYFRLRREATCGPNGSARAVQKDELGGVTHVPKGSPLRFISFETWLGGDDDGLAPAV